MRLHACCMLSALLLSTFASFAQTPTPNSTVPSNSADIPKLVKFSGTATDENGKPLTGVVGVTFSLFKDQQGGAALWVETQNVQADANGHYTAMLGASTSRGVPLEIFSLAEAHWVGTQISGQREQPRILLLSVPYALKAADAETLGGLPASAFVHVSSEAAIRPGGPPAPSPAQPVTTVTGTGKKNFVPIWTGTTTLGDSVLFQSGINIGLGTTKPQAKLESVGAATAVLGSSTGNPGTGVAGVAAEGFGVSGLSIGAINGSTGVYGQASSKSGAVYGVQGLSASGCGAGVQGTNTSSTDGNGVAGFSNATSGFANGVYGLSVSTGGNGVFGSATATSGFANGLNGLTSSPGGNGVFGQNNATSGGAGVSGATSSPDGQGVFGINNATTGGNGVFGNATATSGVANGVNGQTTSPDGNGVFGINNSTSSGTGVKGQAGGSSGIGIGGYATASSGTTAGVEGETNSPDGNGVAGYANASSGNANGVFGQTKSSSGGVGVWGWATAANGLGVAATNTALNVEVAIAGPAPTVISAFVPNSKTNIFNVDTSGNGYFSGNLTVTGNVSKGGGSFKIDHPLDPENKYLSHSFVESPDMMNVYNGNVTSDRRGLATVVLPDYFEVLNKDFRYQLTVIGQFAQAIVKREIENNRFTISTNKPSVKVSWQVTGIRHDAYANAYRIPTEEDKPAAEQGHYLHPEVFGQPASKSIQAGSQKGSAPDQVARESNP